MPFWCFNILNPTIQEWVDILTICLQRPIGEDVSDHDHTHDCMANSKEKVQPIIHWFDFFSVSCYLIKLLEFSLCNDAVLLEHILLPIECHIGSNLEAPPCLYVLDFELSPVWSKLLAHVKQWWYFLLKFSFRSVEFRVVHWFWSHYEFWDVLEDECPHSSWKEENKHPPTQEGH